MYAIGGTPVILDTSRSSSRSAAAAGRSPASIKLWARKFSENCSWTSAPRAARHLHLPFGQRSARVVVPHLDRDDSGDSISREPQNPIDVHRPDAERRNCGERSR